MVVLGKKEKEKNSEKDGDKGNSRKLE